MSDVSPIRAYIDEIDDLPKDALLGRIVLFTISNHPIKRDDLVADFQRLNLNEAFLPAPNKHIDAFKKATSETKETYPLKGGRTAVLLCRDVTTNADQVVRQITREIRDSGRKRLSYDEAIRCVFFKPGTPGAEPRVNFTLNRQSLSSEEVEAVRAVARAMRERYNDFYQHMDDQKIRGMVRNYLKHLNAIEIKGGVYFVPVSRDDELHRLAELVGGLGGACQMNTIPLVDLANQREFIAEVFEREASESLREITKEARELMTNRKSITPAMYTKMRARFDQILANAEEHVENLQITQDMTAATAEVALDALRQLQEKMLDD